MRRLEEKLRAMRDENTALAETLMKTQKMAKVLTDERDAAKKNVTRLLNRKGKFESGAKVCNNCKVEYLEKENFNWSCRTHQSEWGGEMWWCCGKRGKDQPGCKFSKHVTADDGNDEFKDAETREMERNKALRLLQCKCCK